MTYTDKELLNIAQKIKNNQATDEEKAAFLQYLNMNLDQILEILKKVK